MGGGMGGGDGRRGWEEGMGGGWEEGMGGGMGMWRMGRLRTSRTPPSHDGMVKDGWERPL